VSKTQLYFILGLLFALLVAIFALQNPEPVDIDFLVWHFNAISKVLIILVSTAVGALVVVLLGFSWQFRRYLYVRRLEGEAEGLKKELEKARQALAAAQAGGPVEKAEAQEKHVQTNNKPDGEKKTGNEKGQ